MGGPRNRNAKPGWPFNLAKRPRAFTIVIARAKVGALTPWVTVHRSHAAAKKTIKMAEQWTGIRVGGQEFIRVREVMPSKRKRR